MRFTKVELGAIGVVTICVLILSYTVFFYQPMNYSETFEPRLDTLRVRRLLFTELEQRTEQELSIEAESKLTLESSHRSFYSPDDRRREELIDKVVNASPLERDVARTLVKQADKLNIEVDLLLGLIRVESVFDKQNKSHAGAKGLMQLMPETAEWLAKNLGLEYETEKLYDPHYNIKLGTTYVRHLLDTFEGDIHKVLTAYNRGEGGLNTYIRRTGSAVSNFSRIVLEMTDKYYSRMAE